MDIFHKNLKIAQFEKFATGQKTAMEISEWKDKN